MANTSSTGGYLTPAGSALPAQDADLDDLMQAVVVGITGLDGAMVRPRWQPVAAKMPEPDTDWCALGVTVEDADAGPAIIHSSAGAGSDTYIRHENIQVLASFYGPHGMSYASQLRDGIAIPQNTESLRATDTSVVIGGETIRAVPELINQQWLRRYDLVLNFRRKVTRTYAVQNITSVAGRLIDDTGHVNEPLTVTGP